MFIENVPVETENKTSNKSQWIMPAIDAMFLEQEKPAEVRTPSSVCAQCSYSAYAEQLGCINEFASCPYLGR